MAFSDLVLQAYRTELAAFGETVTYTPTAGSPPPAPVSPIGIFYARFELANGDAHAGVEALGPAVFLVLTDLPTDPQVDDPTVTIRGVTYHVIEAMPDGMGGVVLALRAVG